ncbi:MAG: PDZ domain-containing protein [candidate division Zixibacteria bacterium]|nr:PDZ domain-containing protein [candidate division Zixibacteria bacterium]
MNTYYEILISAVVLNIALCVTGYTREIKNPYEILNRSFDAVGGLEKLKAEKTTYSEGAISLGGMDGAIKIWTRKPNLSRVELSLGPLNIIQGDNGENAWVLDQNGKLQVITNPDDAEEKRRQLTVLYEDYAYAQPESDVFTVALESIELLEKVDCYVVRITNNINNDSHIYYINTRSFLKQKAVFLEGENSHDSYYGDYRRVNDILIPFWQKDVDHQTGQVKVMELTKYVSDETIPDSIFEPPEEGAKDYEFLNGMDRVENIPFEFIENHLYIPVLINGKERLFILDTGAGISVLNQDFAEELNLDLEGELKGRGAGGTVVASLTKLPSFTVAGIRFKEQTAAVIDMDNLKRRIGVDFAGILGYDFLSRFVTRVDYANELLSFYAPESYKYSGTGQIIDMHFQNSVFNVRATLDGGHTGNWLLDIGAGVSHIDGRYALREGFSEKDGVLLMGHGAGNEYLLKKIRCDNIDFAGFTINNPVISFPYGGTDTNFTSDRIGILGNSLFRNFILCLDYGNERLIVEKGKKFNHIWPEDNSGLQVALNGEEQVEVIYVSPGTPADKSGFIKGDIILAINGLGVDTFGGLLSIRKLLRADPGTKYNFRVERKNQNRELDMKLSKLF